MVVKRLGQINMVTQKAALALLAEMFANDIILAPRSPSSPLSS